MDLAERLARYRRFYAGDPAERLLIVISYGGGEPGEPTGLGDYDFCRMSEHRRYWDATVRNQLVATRNHEGIPDDWISGVEVYYGFGAFGAVFGDGKLHFTDRTSFIGPAGSGRAAWAACRTRGYDQPPTWRHPTPDDSPSGAPVSGCSTAAGWRGGGRSGARVAGPGAALGAGRRGSQPRPRRRART